VHSSGGGFFPKKKSGSHISLQLGEVGTLGGKSREKKMEKLKPVRIPFDVGQSIDENGRTSPQDLEEGGKRQRGRGKKLVKDVMRRGRPCPRTSCQRGQMTNTIGGGKGLEASRTSEPRLVPVPRKAPWEGQNWRGLVRQGARTGGERIEKEGRKRRSWKKWGEKKRDKGHRGKCHKSGKNQGMRNRGIKHVYSKGA